MDIRNKFYYKIAKEGSLNISHPSARFIQKYGKKAVKILDFGCGEGTRLSLIENNKAEKVGVDQSRTAILFAKKQYPKMRFIKTGNGLPFNDSYFDFVYSAFVLEHTDNPEDFLNEAVRVLSPGGILLFVAPNFGAPNRESPNGKSIRAEKLINGIGKDLRYLFKNRLNTLNWKKVTPQKDYIEIDMDTTVEPYLLTLEKYLANLNIKKVFSSSLWSEDGGFKISQFIFKFFGMLNIYPFSYWGPHILFIGRKYK